MCRDNGDLLAKHLQKWLIETDIDLFLKIFD